MISSNPARAAAAATSTLYFQTRRSYGFVHPRPAASLQTEPSDRRIARSGRARESTGSSNVDDAPDEVDPARMYPTRDLAWVVVVARRARRSRQGNRGGREPDLAVLVLHVELERRQAVALQIEVLVELAWQRRERRRHVDAAKLDRKRSRPVPSATLQALRDRQPSAGRRSSRRNARQRRGAASATRNAPTAALRLRRFLRLIVARRSRNRSFGSMGGNSIDTGAWTLPQPS